MAHHRLVDRDLVERVKDAGAELYAWTVDESTLIDRLTGLEVTGITTNDPRLFAPAPLRVARASRARDDAAPTGSSRLSRSTSVVELVAGAAAEPPRPPRRSASIGASARQVAVMS